MYSTTTNITYEVYVYIHFLGFLLLYTRSPYIVMPFLNLLYRGDWPETHRSPPASVSCVL